MFANERFQSFHNHKENICADTISLTSIKLGYRPETISISQTRNNINFSIADVPATISQKLQQSRLSKLAKRVKL